MGSAKSLKSTGEKNNLFINKHNMGCVEAKKKKKTEQCKCRQVKN